MISLSRDQPVLRKLAVLPARGGFRFDSCVPHGHSSPRELSLFSFLCLLCWTRDGNAEIHVCGFVYSWSNGVSSVCSGPGRMGGPGRLGFLRPLSWFPL